MLTSLNKENCNKSLLIHKKWELTRRKTTVKKEEAQVSWVYLIEKKGQKWSKGEQQAPNIYEKWAKCGLLNET